jgi:hypothetical protein
MSFDEKAFSNHLRVIGREATRRARKEPNWREDAFLYLEISAVNGIVCRTNVRRFAGAALLKKLGPVSAVYITNRDTAAWGWRLEEIREAFLPGVEIETMHEVSGWDS